MEIQDSFRVELPVEEAWRLLLDVERIAPCLPGAQLQEIEGDEYRGIVKVKVGPITAQYKGSARFESIDEAAHAAVLVGNGRDTRGQGNASATVTLGLAADGSGTRVDISTDLAITGKVAQFGRGVMADVSSKLLGQFVENLERDVLGSGDGVVDLREDTSAPDAAALEAAPEADEGNARATEDLAAVAAGSRPAAEPSGNGAAVRHIDSPEPEAVELLALGGAPLLKRLVPVFVVGILGIAILVKVRWWRRRHR